MAGSVGTAVGLTVGGTVGEPVGLTVGDAVGDTVGLTVGKGVDEEFDEPDGETACADCDDEGVCITAAVDGDEETAVGCVVAVWVVWTVSFAVAEVSVGVTVCKTVCVVGSGSCRRFRNRVSAAVAMMSSEAAAPITEGRRRKSGLFFF